MKLALAGAINLYASQPILDEYEELLRRKGYPMDTRRATLLLKKIREASTMVKPTAKLSETKDPDDNIFLECAQTAKAEYLIARQHPSLSQTLEVHPDCPSPAVYGTVGRGALPGQAIIKPSGVPPKFLHVRSPR